MQRSSSTKLRVPCFHPFYASSLMQAIGDHAPRWPPLRAEAGSLKSSNAPNCTLSPCCPSDGSSSVPSRGSTDAEDWPRIGRTSIARRSLSCASLQSVSCCENFAIQSDVSGQTHMGRFGVKGCDSAAHDEYSRGCFGIQGLSPIARPGRFLARSNSHPVVA